MFLPLLFFRKPPPAGLFSARMAPLDVQKRIRRKECASYTQGPDVVTLVQNFIAQETFFMMRCALCTTAEQIRAQTGLIIIQASYTVLAAARQPAHRRESFSTWSRCFVGSTGVPTRGLDATAEDPRLTKIAAFFAGEGTAQFFELLPREASA